MSLSATQIEQACREKEQELLEKHFGNLIHEAVVEKPETIGEYTPKVPLKVEQEYVEFLKQLWDEVAPSNLKGTPLVLEEQKLREIVTSDDIELVAHAYKNATRRTLRERITKTNHKDVRDYKALLKEYTRELLETARLDFMEEITGVHISNKAFEK